ncbi:hypothetical protein ACIQCR_05740 [Streptomyces sp. NPDC093249]|uniref:hypothetical protein n=1 Tax=unclassified Streptomyces TaxID=2593676 RepID=UPI0034502D3C
MTEPAAHPAAGVGAEPDARPTGTAPGAPVGVEVLVDGNLTGEELNTLFRAAWPDTGTPTSGRSSPAACSG